MRFQCMNLTRHRTASLTAGLVLSVFAALPLWAFGTDEIVKVITDAHILTPGYEIKPVLTTDAASITTFRNPKASDKDCKIDAALIARQVISLDGKKFKSVSVYFYDTKNPFQYTKAVVGANNVVNFGDGKLSQAKLIDSVSLTKGLNKAQANPLGKFHQQSYGQILQRPDVVPGPMLAERAQLLKQIRQLGASKIDKRVMQTLSENFVLIEDLARYNQSESLAQQITLLKQRIAERNLGR